LAGLLSGACSTGADAPGGSGGSGQTTGTGGSSPTGTGGSSPTGSGGSSPVDGGGTGGMVSTGPSVCDGAGTRVLALTEVKVDNFEGPMLLDGWSTFNDVMPMNSIKMLQEAPGALATGHFGHYAGMGAKTPVMGGFGVGAIFNVAIDRSQSIFCIDISAFDGVSFWAKAAKAGSKVGVNFVVPATNDVPGGGDCVTGCYVHPQKAVTLTTEWAQYSVTFAEAAGGKVKVTNKIQEIGWLSPDSNWDFSIDEIQFYKGTLPTGPVPAN
jgi:hypothetical protein